MTQPFLSNPDVKQHLIVALEVQNSFVGFLWCNYDESFTPAIWRRFEPILACTRRSTRMHLLYATLRYAYMPSLHSMEPVESVL